MFVQVGCCIAGRWVWWSDQESVQAAVKVVVAVVVVVVVGREGDEDMKDWRGIQRTGRREDAQKGDGGYIY